MGYRIGCDIGGTFTDLILYNDEDHDIKIYKLLSSPESFETSVIAGIQRIIKDNNIPVGEVYIICHSTTVALNTLIERKGDKTALITTEGFRDVLEIGRVAREHEYDQFQEKVAPLVPRHLRFEIEERMNYKGDVVKKINENSLLSVIENMKEQNIRSIAVSLLHSYANPEHEKKVRELIQSVMPDAFVTLSSEINPVYREYERTSSTVINAYVAKRCVEYLEKLQKKIKTLGLECKIQITQSSGGLMTLNAAKDKPVHILMAGPAAGVYAASSIANLSGYRNVIALDTGGTTQLVSLVIDGKITPIINAKIGGYPVRTPVVDVRAIGAGGGSIARVDSGRRLTVGPESAGASPGPACYGNGGEEPTVTDADVALGYLNPDYFLGGDIKLHKENALSSIEEKIAKPLNMNVMEAASGIIEVVNSLRIGSIRKLLIQEGHDPRDFAIVAFGGAGPVHAAELAKELEVEAVIVPNHPGLLSPVGSLSGKQRRDFIQTINAEVDQLDVLKLIEVCNKIKQKLLDEFESTEGISREEVNFQTLADVKYEGQLDELIIDIPNNEKEINRDLIKKLFFEEHHKLFGYHSEDEKVVLTNLRIVASVHASEVIFKEHEQKQANLSKALKGNRGVYFKEYGKIKDIPIYNRAELGLQDKVMGPAIIEEYDSTTVVYPNQQASVDNYSNLIISSVEGKDDNKHAIEKIAEVNL